MSLISKKTITCSHCGSQDEITVYRSINVADDPELKEKVKDGSAFVWQCPHCGQANLAKYESLYHDPERKLMVWLIPTGDMPAGEMQAITNHAKAMGAYTLRRVGDISSLMEKILISDAGLDDVVIEMCKYVTRVEMAAKAGEAQATQILNLPMHFYRTGEQDGVKYITLSFPDNGQMVGCNIGFNVYEDCAGILSRNPSIEVEEGFAKVDAAWLSSLMG